MRRTAVVLTTLLILACALPSAGCTMGVSYQGFTTEVASPSVLTTAPVDPACFANCADTIERMEAEEAARLAAIEAERKAEEEAAARAAAAIAAASAAAARPAASTRPDSSGLSEAEIQNQPKNYTCKHCGVTVTQAGLTTVACPSCGAFGWY